MRFAYADPPYLGLAARFYGDATYDRIEAHEQLKPTEFCFWLFRLLGLEANDDFADLFSGSGQVTRALDLWRSQLCLDLEMPA